MKITLLIIVLFLVNIYVLLGIWYGNNSFTISLDSTADDILSLILYEDPVNKSYVQSLAVKNDMRSFSDYSVNWIPNDIHDPKYVGTHNGEHYLAYSFYVENAGPETIKYRREIIIDDVVRNVDEAIRVAVYKDDEECKVYGKCQKKLNGDTKKEKEPDTTNMFFTDDNNITDVLYGENTKKNIAEDLTDEVKGKMVIMSEESEEFKPRDSHRYTIVVWVEGDDPECVNDIIGGEIKMHMRFVELHHTEN